MSLRRTRQTLGPLSALILSTIHAGPARAASCDVPLTHPTLQAAVAAAALSADADNVITISATPVLTSTTISLGPAFDSARRLA